ncbi:hypothetical protein [Pelagovum sp. HNIBRBA483]|uniref:hypothetical protein n=1 Tax=Pelagovum sp. HNIBRBA483 TaxID=3233341 RepID=UPI0034A10A86
MSKSKKHSPMQEETEQSIVSQVPEELMTDFIDGLVALAQKRKEGNLASHDNQEKIFSPSEVPEDQKIRLPKSARAILQQFKK